MRKGNGGKHVRVSPHMRRSLSVGPLSSTAAVSGYEWVRDDILKCKSCLTLAASVVVLQCQVKLANLEDSYKLTVQAYGNDDLSFLMAAPGRLPFFFMYKCLFEVLGVILPLTAFQCALLEHLNVAPSQLHPNS